MSLFAIQSGLAEGLKSPDLYRFRSVTDVQLAPDEKHIVYTILMNDKPGKPYGQSWIMDVASRKSVRLGERRKRRRCLGGRQTGV